MNREIYRFMFEPLARMQDVEESLLLAVLAAECLHGQARVRMDATYCVDTGKSACVIDATSVVGRDICRIFTGFAIREFGETAFKVQRPQGNEAVSHRLKNHE
jgi:hypothetical protein